MLCKNCRRKIVINKDVRFCPFCGKPVKRNVSAKIMAISGLFLCFVGSALLLLREKELTDYEYMENYVDDAGISADEDVDNEALEESENFSEKNNFNDENSYLADEDTYQAEENPYIEEIRYLDQTLCLAAEEVQARLGEPISEQEDIFVKIYDAGSLLNGKGEVFQIQYLEAHSLSIDWECDLPAKGDYEYVNEQDLYFVDALSDALEEVYGEEYDISVSKENGRYVETCEWIETNYVRGLNAYCVQFVTRIPDGPGVITVELHMNWG